MQAPLVSVLTPSYGYGQYIKDAIHSVKKQSLARTEHIIQDAESSDATISILESFGEAVNWRSGSDLGQSDALNKAIDRAQGEWIGWLNADEFYLPGVISVLLTHAIRSGADVVYGDAVFVDAEGKLLRLLPQHRFSEHVLRWYGQPFIPSCSVLFRREVLGHAPWNVHCRAIMDYELYLRLSQEGRRFLHVPIVGGAFRVHKAQVTAQPRERFAQEELMVAQRYDVPRGTFSPLGRSYHGLLKIIDSAYYRQIRARGLKGSDLRWFLGDEQREAVRALLLRSYPQNESP